MRSRVLAGVFTGRSIAVPRHDPRAAVARALSRCATRERVLLALLLFERLTPAEAAHVLRVPAARVERAYAALLSELRETLGAGGPYPAMPANVARPVAQLRRAS
jgi:DNA-directed RNA polymerase specialized sigma24 family protein